MFTLQFVPVPNLSFCVRELGAETIILSGTGDVIHVLDEMGTEVWKNLDGEKSLGDILAGICNEWDVERSVAEKDLMAFIEALAEKNIISVPETA